MAEHRCPLCGCKRFYVKNPDDEYDLCEFDCIDGEPVFDSNLEADQRPDIEQATETYCNQCAWHGRFGDLAP